MFSFLTSKAPTLPTKEDALPGRRTAMQLPNEHAVNGHVLQPPFPDKMQTAVFGMGCFWGAERKFWELPGVYSTAVGYAAGFTKNPSYKEVCSGQTAHNEVVLVVFNPDLITYTFLLHTFWESHNPTQGMRQGNDSGTQYRSGIYTSNDEQLKLAQASKVAYAERLKSAGHGAITTEVLPATKFYYAEDHHQQYLYKNPAGYCGIGGTGVSCPVGIIE